MADDDSDKDKGPVERQNLYFTTKYLYSSISV